MLLKEQYQVLIKSLLPYAQKQLGFKKPPIINFEEDEENSKNPLGKTAYYHPQDKEITIFVTNRHPKDILRSVAHELVHYKQDEDGRLTKSMRHDLHDKNYTQNNAELRKFEEEAYLEGNMIFRDWEDNYKNGSKTLIKITKESKEMTESVLRNTIKRLVAEMVKEEKEKKEEERATPTVRKSAKTRLKQDRIMTEKEDTESVSLNEWKNQELFGLLTKRFGIISEKQEMSPQEINLAAKYPPKNKITRGDIITAAKEKAGNEEEEKEKEEELDETKLSKAETEEKERLVQGMKKSEKDFEKRYPGRGKQVMYATATKTAQEKK